MAAVDYFNRDPVVHTWTYKLDAPDRTRRDLLSYHLVSTTEQSERESVPIAVPAVRTKLRVDSGKVDLSGMSLVGVAGFEPATPSSRTRCSA